MKELKTSEILSSFIKFLEQCKNEYYFCEDELNKQEALTQDLLHKIEFNEGGRNERNRAATILKNCRQDRRAFKDRTEELEPLVSFICDESGKHLINQLKNVLGEVRKKENYHKNRFYIPRVLKDFKLNSNKEVL